jgi:hypothetical protein
MCLVSVETVERTIAKSSHEDGVGALFWNKIIRASLVP